MQSLIDANAAAQYLGVHVETVRKLARQKRIPGLQVGDAWRFSPEKLEEWVASKLNSATEGKP